MKKSISSIIAIVCLAAVFGAAVFGVGKLTAPIIEKNNSGAELAPLKEVMPDAEGFELIYDASGSVNTALSGVSAEVSKIYRETSGKGFAFKCSTTSQYSKSPLEFTLGISMEGKIVGVKIDSYDETLDFEDYPQTFIGTDSTLAGVTLHAGVTFSSTAFKNAVISSFNALIDNELMKATEKGPEQLLAELIPTVHTGMQNGGNLKASEIDASGNVVKAYTADNGSGVAAVVKKGENFVLVVLNNMGGAAAFDVEGNDVTADCGAEIDEAKKLLADNSASETLLEKRITAWFADASAIENVTTSAMNTVVSAKKFVSEGKTYYGFYSKSFGFKDMDIYYVLDENGAISKMTAQTFIFEEEYFGAFKTANPGWTAADYVKNYYGLNGETYNGDSLMIAAATMSSNAFKTSTSDVFAAFSAIEGGAN